MGDRIIPESEADLARARAAAMESSARLRDAFLALYLANRGGALHAAVGAEVRRALRWGANHPDLVLNAVQALVEHEARTAAADALAAETGR